MADYRYRAKRSTVAGLALILMCGTGHPQRQLPQGGSPSASQSNPVPSLGPDRTPEQQERLSKMQNNDRQRRLEADTEKLLALATQLHDDVGKTNKNILSVDVIKRAEEIEKLAHSVKERMKG